MEEPGPTIKRILLVDDEQALLEAQSEILHRLGYFVAPSRDAADALELFNANPHEFDLVIADEMMPGMAGSEMCRRMREVRVTAVWPSISPSSDSALSTTGSAAAGTTRPTAPSSRPASSRRWSGRRRSGGSARGPPRGRGWSRRARGRAPGRARWPA